MRIYVDPETGKFGSPPAGESIVAEPRDALRLPAEEELVEVRGTTSGGGYTVDLKRRFGGSMNARTAAGGQIVTECQPGVRPAGGEK
jgi:hypothetical protein